MEAEIADDVVEAEVAKEEAPDPPKRQRKQKLWLVV
jgi:hypothetical protein